MDFISITATAVEKLKRQAKILRKTTGTSLAVALDAIAKQEGFHHWKHVTLCLEQTANLRSSKLLPESLKAFLDSTSVRRPALDSTQAAFAQGFVFAMDVKDAQDILLQADYEECDDGWHIAARDLWRSLVHYRDDEAGVTLFETQSPDDLLRTALDDLPNYRFFRYTGAKAPASLELAYQQIQEMSFFPATHIWLGGKFIDSSEVSEVQVNGQVAHAKVQGKEIYQASDTRSRMERFGHLLTEQDRELFKIMTPEARDMWLFQLEKETPLGKARYQPIQTSVAVSWQDSKKL